MSPEETRRVGAEIGMTCRCMKCGCPAGRGHNHPRYGEWRAAVTARP
jgi:hypothetical protein